MRELTRVATPENEHEFLSKAHGRTARDVERMVAGLRRGDGPEADPDPKLIKKKVFLEISAPVWARYRRLRSERDKENGERLSDDEFLERLLREAEAPGADQVTKPAVQVAVTTCKKCKDNFVSVDGEQVPIDDVTAERLICDSVFIGDLETNDLTRPKSHIPDAIRRKVMQRDGYACIVPGCRSTRNLDVHHFRERQNGGQHTTENCGSLCGGHHTQCHDGRLVITGTPGVWLFQWRPDGDVDTATNGPPPEFIDEDEPAPRHLKLVEPNERSVPDGARPSECAERDAPELRVVRDDE